MGIWAALEWILLKFSSVETPVAEGNSNILYQWMHRICRTFRTDHSWWLKCYPVHRRGSSWLKKLWVGPRLADEPLHEWMQQVWSAWEKKCPSGPVRRDNGVLPPLSPRFFSLAGSLCPDFERDVQHPQTGCIPPPSGDAYRRPTPANRWSIASSHTVCFRSNPSPPSSSLTF